MNSNYDDLLKQAIEAARDGDRATARALIEELLEEDPDNAKAWFLLYRVSESLEEKKLALKKVLSIDPGNDKAQEALARLNVRMGGSADDEVAPGINRRTLTIVIGVVIGIAVIGILLAIVIITGNNAASSNARATQTGVIVNQTLTMVAALAAETQAAIDIANATETQIALVSPTPTPTETVIGPPTLPPTFTPTASPTPLVTPTPLAPPPPLPGLILGWGGVDASSDGYLRVISMPLSGGGAFTEISGDQRGRYVTAKSLSEIIYARWVVDSFSLELQQLDSVTGNTDILGSRWFDVVQVFYRTNQPSFSPTDNRLVFIGLATDTNSYEVFVYDPSMMGGNPVIRVTNDNSNYSWPTFTADGSRVIAVKADANNTNHDLVTIDLTTYQQLPLTSDGDAVIEQQPRVSPDGQILAYVSKTSIDGAGDLVIYPLSGIVSPITLTSDDADDLFPVFSPDNRFLAFASNRYSPNHQIYIYDINSGAQYQLSRDPAASFFPGTWLP